MSVLIARSLAEAASFGPCALTIGNFDGVHLGHQALLRATVAAARERGVRSVVLMFSPHPACIVAPERAPRLLTSPEQRCDLMAEQGIEAVLILPFTAELAKVAPEDFAARFLRDGLRASVVLVGDNFRFGNRHAGDTAMLARLGGELGFETQFLSAVKWRGLMVSASEIRNNVAAGDVTVAGRLLGRPFHLEGGILAGHGIGSKQTVPTLNLDTAAEVLPREGVYVTRTFDVDSDRHWNSITNVGRRPTFENNGPISIETFLLSPFDGLAPSRIRLEFLRRVREEKKFPNPESLKTQIMADVKRATAYFRHVAFFVKRRPADAPKVQNFAGTPDKNN
ncbi:MAG: bifunctional riboflavin kinase/FAD synthetase [Acidobacteriota bacterium]